MMNGVMSIDWMRQSKADKGKQDEIFGEKYDGKSNFLRKIRQIFMPSIEKKRDSG
ncbi:MAG: hypothetical protein LBL13_13070 [Bacteroidales bacterium]|jgi:hypothetical protein|nr:hypothetical protein [Bacteroidales bacterium]